MRRSTPKINVILHEPRSARDIQHINNITQNAYIRTITRTLRNAPLTNAERRYVIDTLKSIYSESRT